MNSSTCYQFSLSVKKWKKKNFLRKNEIFANEGLYYRFFVTLKPILYWSMRYQFCLSLKNRKKTIFHEKMRFFHRRINSSSFLLCWSWICPFQSVIRFSCQSKMQKVSTKLSNKLNVNISIYFNISSVCCNRRFWISSLSSFFWGTFFPFNKRSVIATAMQPQDWLSSFKV